MPRTSMLVSAYLEHADATKDLVHKSNALITSLHEIILRTNNDLARVVVDRQEH